MQKTAIHKIDLKLRPSKCFIAGLILILGLSLLIISTLHMNYWLRGIIAGVTLRYGLAILKKDGFLTNGYSIFRLRGGEGGWLINDRLGESPVELLGESTITNLVCILRFKLINQPGKRTCLIFRDALDAGLYRQLLVFLRSSVV